MQFNCDTKHGHAFATVERTLTGASVLIQWRPHRESLPIVPLHYHFAPPLPWGMTSATPDSEYAHRALSHFDSVRSPHIHREQTLTFDEIEINYELHLAPVG